MLTPPKCLQSLIQLGICPLLEMRGLRFVVPNDSHGGICMNVKIDGIANVTCHWKNERLSIIWVYVREIHKQEAGGGDG